MDESTGLDLQRIIDDSIRTSRGLAVNVPVQVVAEYPAHLPSVEIQREELTGVLTSIVTHILRGTFHSEITVRASLLSAEAIDAMSSIPAESRPHASDTGPWVHVSISDTDIKILQLANDMFLNATQIRAKTNEGLLSISECVALVEKSGGELWVEYQEDIGSRYHLLLRLHAATVKSHDLSKLYRAVETHIPEGDSERKTLLLLTDNHELQLTLAEDLVSGGYRVLSTGSGSEFLKLAEKEHVELLLLDIDLRDPPVFDLAMLLNANPQTTEIPLLFLTTMGDAEGKSHIGAVDFLSRPVGTGKLLSIVNDFLGKRLNPSDRVLVIEPDEALRSSLIMTIRSHDYRVTEASGAEEALVLAERFTPGLILVNAVIANDRDYWLLRQLRRLSVETEILVLADRYSEVEGQEAINRGASRYAETGKLPDLLDDAG